MGPQDWDYDGGVITLRLFDLSESGPGPVWEGVEVLAETVSIQGDSSPTVADAPSDPLWLTFTLTTPFELKSDALYAFSVGASGGLSNEEFFMNLDGTATDSYAGGFSMTVPGDSSHLWDGDDGQPSDRAFVVAMTAASNGEPPAVLTGVSATAGSTRVDLNWDDSNDPDFASYTVYRSTTSGSGYAEVATGLSDSHFVDRSVLNDVTYYYVVTVEDVLQNESSYSEEVSVAPEDIGSFLDWAAKPTLGWNSWDIYGTTITEAQTKAQADYMSDNLLVYGWDLITVDIQWYAPDPAAAASGNYYVYYTPSDELVMDAFGRLQPAVTRFPSAADGKGFKELADYVHSKGLRFGIHIMRGIPKQAVYDNLPVYGTDDGTGNPYTAQEIADTNSFCPWNPDMFGVDVTRPGGQAYYDSLFNLYAEWGVDFVKVDDISRPYNDFQKAEIEAIRAAIDKTGRPMVLSLSPGETPLSAGDHVMDYANQWRVSDDFWDYWGALYDQFERLHNWTPYRGAGHFPDADMLPLGKISASSTDLDGRPTNFTQNEQYTLMTLWSIARSPLIHGGDMTQMDAFTLSLFTNEEVLAVNQDSEYNRQLYREGDRVAWVANDALSSDLYLAVFNTGGGSTNVPVELAELGFTGSVQIRSLWDRSDLGAHTGVFSPSVASHGAQLYRLSGARLDTPWISGVSADADSATITWEAIPTASSYSVKRSLSETGPFTTIASDLSEVTYTDTTVDERTVYYYVVSAIFAGGESPDSLAREVLTDGIPSTVSWNLDSFSTVGGAGVGTHSGEDGQAGVLLVGNWTNSWPADPRTNLIDDVGHPTTMDIAYAGGNAAMLASHPGQDADGSWNKEMLNGYLNAGSGGTSSITVSEIPHDLYDIIVYFSSDAAGRNGSITNGDVTYYFTTLGNSSISSSNAVLTQTTDTTGGVPPAANYAVFSSLSGTEQTITCDINQWGGIAGIQISPANLTGVLPNGVYQLSARHAPLNALDVLGGGVVDGTNVIQSAQSDGDRQSWTLTHLGNDVYSITNVLSGKALQVAGSGVFDGANVEIGAYTAAPSQMWKITEVETGFYRLSPMSSPERCMDVNGASLNDGASVIQWTYFGQNNQQWSFEMVAPPQAPQAVSTTGGLQFAELDWQASWGAESYSVYRSTTNRGGFSEIANDVTTTSFTDSDLNSDSTYFYKLAAVNAWGQSDLTEAVSVQTLSMPVGSWREIWYGTSVNAGDAADDATPHSHGMPNIVVYGLLGPDVNPAMANPGELPQPYLAGDSLRFTFTEPTGVMGVIYGAEWSTSLLSDSWLPVVDTGIGNEHVFNVPFDTNQQVFLRLTVEGSE